MNAADSAPWRRPDNDQPGNGLAIALIAVTALVLVALLGVLAGLGLSGGDAAAAARTSAVPSPSRPVPSASPTASPPPGAAQAAVGDCVTNSGGSAYLAITACRPGTYQVLQRFAGTADPSRCDTIAGTTDDYVQRDLSTASRSFVLCLQKQ